MKMYDEAYRRKLGNVVSSLINERLSSVGGKHALQFKKTVGSMVKNSLVSGHLADTFITDPLFGAKMASQPEVMFSRASFDSMMNGVANFISKHAEKFRASKGIIMDTSNNPASALLRSTDIHETYKMKDIVKKQFSIDYKVGAVKNHVVDKILDGRKFFKVPNNGVEQWLWSDAQLSDLGREARVHAWIVEWNSLVSGKPFGVPEADKLMMETFREDVKIP